MNKSVLFIMGGALVVAILVAVLVQAQLSPKSAAAPIDTVEILVASKDLMTGNTLKAEDVRWQSWPEASLFKGVIKKSDEPDETKLDVYDVPLRRNIQSGEPVTRQALIADIKGGNNFLAASIDPGMRAVAVQVSAGTTAGGFVAPGDHVDVVLSYAPQIPSGSEDYAGSIIQHYASQTILSNIKVLAADQTATSDDHEAKVAKTVTLEVTRTQAQTLALATKMGEISLSLRRIGEIDTDQDKQPTLTTDATTSDVLQRIGVVRSKGKTNSNIIRMYNGATIENVPVRALPRNSDAQGSDTQQESN